MSWDAPNLSHLLDHRLQTARLELLEDPRIAQAFHGQGRDTTQFLRHLVEEKLAAAARSGLGAVEASLRSSASDYLAASGLGPESIRKTLDALGADIMAVEGVRPPMLQRDSMEPHNAATLFFVAWLVSISVGWAVGDANTVLFVALATGGALASLLVYLFAKRVRLKRRAEVAREYPTALCRAFLAALEQCVEAYGVAVNRTDGKG